MIREGRLGAEVDEDFAVYTSSLSFDRKIFRFDIIASMAHAMMLEKIGVINKEELSDILRGLHQILNEGFESLDIDPRLEDIHVAVEKKLIKKIGATGGKLHTARSRNDQIACDLRLWIREEIVMVYEDLLKLISVLLQKSEENVNTIIPGYTHLQRAQPTTLAHHFLAYVDTLLRNTDRLLHAYHVVNKNPLGACAFATSSFPIDREFTTKILGFDEVLENSMDAVSSRDFMIELLFCLATIMIDLSRISEEIVLWSTQEFGFVELSSNMCSTSSIMPQKKNPDALELLRAKSSRVIGNLASGLTILRALPQSYNRDLQELSPIVAESLDISRSSIRVLRKIIETMKINKDKTRESCDESILATDLADFLVKIEKIPFREAHRLVATSISTNTIDTLFDLYEKKTGKKLTPEIAVKERKVRGGPSPEEVKRILKEKREHLEILYREIKRIKDKHRSIEEYILKMVDSHV